MKPTQEILTTLPNFTGTTAYYRYSPIFRNFVLTDGSKYLAEACDAFWLMDAIASHLPSYRDEGFVVARLAVVDARASLTFDDGNGNILASQEIEFTTFPLGSITLYVIPQDMGDEVVYVILLASEY